MQVYDLPVELSLTAAQTAQCRWSAYSSELFLHSLLVNASSTSTISSMITTDPSLADVFFIPLFPACYLFNCWVEAGWNRTGRCGVDEKYIEPAMQWIQKQSSWKRNGGKDHLIVHPMDFVDGYYKESSRALMNESIHLVTVGDLRPTPYSQHYRRHRDIVIPSGTHLLNVYYLNPRDYLDESGHPILETLTEVEEFAKNKVDIASAEIFEPTPRNIKDGGIWNTIFGGKNRRNTKFKTKRTTTAIFRGGIGPAHEKESYSLSIRSLFFPSSSHPGFSSLPHYDIALSSPNHEYAYALSKAKFGLVPPGYTLDTTRLWEYLAFGVVPVFIGTGSRGGQVLPFEDDFDYDSFSLFIPRSKVHCLPNILENISDERYEELRKQVWKVGRLLVLENSRGNVWKWIGRDLCRMMGKGMGAGERTNWI